MWRVSITNVPDNTCVQEDGGTPLQRLLSSIDSVMGVDTSVVALHAVRSHARKNNKEYNSFTSWNKRIVETQTNSIEKHSIPALGDRASKIRTNEVFPQSSTRKNNSLNKILQRKSSMPRSEYSQIWLAGITDEKLDLLLLRYSREVNIS